MSIEVQQILTAFRTLSPEDRQSLSKALASEQAVSTKSPKPAGLAASICGKYAFVPTSSEAFLARKREDSASEN